MSDESKWALASETVKAISAGASIEAWNSATSVEVYLAVKTLWHVQKNGEYHYKHVGVHTNNASKCIQSRCCM